MDGIEETLKKLVVEEEKNKKLFEKWKKFLSVKPGLDEEGKLKLVMELESYQKMLKEKKI